MVTVTITIKVRFKETLYEKGWVEESEKWVMEVFGREAAGAPPAGDASKYKQCKDKCASEKDREFCMDKCMGL